MTTPKVVSFAKVVAVKTAAVAKIVATKTVDLWKKITTKKVKEEEKEDGEQDETEN